MLIRKFFLLHRPTNPSELFLLFHDDDGHHHHHHHHHHPSSMRICFVCAVSETPVRRDQIHTCRSAVESGPVMKDSQLPHSTTGHSGSRLFLCNSTRACLHQRNDSTPRRVVAALVPLLSQMNPVHTLIPYCCRICLDNILV